jgi:hypothetical protein
MATYLKLAKYKTRDLLPEAQPTQLHNVAELEMLAQTDQLAQETHVSQTQNNELVNDSIPFHLYKVKLNKELRSNPSLEGFLRLIYQHQQHQ